MMAQIPCIVLVSVVLQLESKKAFPAAHGLEVLTDDIGRHAVINGGRL